MLLAWLLLITSTTALAGPCPAAASGERVRVAHVYDGDTLKLTDGRRLRLIGINTPETGARDGTPQPLAGQARDALQGLVDASNRTLLLQYGSEQHDHYGRLLAHAFTLNGDNVAADLLQRGLATALVVPPNTWGMDCYRHLEDEARIDRRGLWALPGYQVYPARTLPLDTRGFRIVQGRVSGIRESRHTVWIQLEGPLSLQIDRRDLAAFGDPADLVGRTFEVRGWVKPNGDALRMRLQHPSAMTAITTSPPQAH